MQDAQVQGEKAQACDKTSEEGRESGGKRDHDWVERAGKTSWRQWHFVSLLVKIRGVKGKNTPEQKCVDICMQTDSRFAPRQAIH